MQPQFLMRITTLALVAAGLALPLTTSLAGPTSFKMTVVGDVRNGSVTGGGVSADDLSLEYIVRAVPTAHFGPVWALGTIPVGVDVEGNFFIDGDNPNVENGFTLWRKEVGGPDSFSAVFVSGGTVEATDQPGIFRFVANYVVTSGTGRFEAITGSGQVIGIFENSEPFEVQANFTGTVDY